MKKKVNTTLVHMEASKSAFSQKPFDFLPTGFSTKLTLSFCSCGFSRVILSSNPFLLAMSFKILEHSSTLPLFY